MLKKVVKNVFKRDCQFCKGTGVCPNCKGQGCSACAVKDVLAGVYRGPKVGKCPACGGTGKK